MKTIIGWMITVTLTVAFGMSVQATDRFVSLAGTHQPPFTNWVTAATDIQAAVNAAANGETVWVAAGKYVLITQVSIANGITVKASGSPSSAIVDGGYPARTNRCFYLNHSGAMLDGLAITNGYTAPDQDGGGVYVNAGSVINCLITRNTGDTRIGGNPGNGGGAVLNNGMISNCVISFNRAIGNYARGGAVIMNGGTVWGCTIASNTCEQATSGVELGDGLLANCQIIGNSGGHGGGGGVTAWGGIIRNCLIVGNSSSDGGGIRIGDGSTTVVDNCTIVNNHASGYGGSQYARGGGMAGEASFYAATVRNCIIVSNTSASGIGLNYACRNDGVVSNISFSCATPLPIGIGNTNASPRFLNFAANNFNLSTNSPCIDKGTNQAWMAGATDLNENQRIVNGIVDMGAYEANPDTDADGIPDWWMVLHFGHPTGQAGDQSLAGDDPDHDAYTNLEEFQNGGNPKVFDIGSAYIWTAVEIGWKGVAGTNYQVQYTTNLSSGNWTNWGGTIVGNGSMNTVLDSTRTNACKFYRVVVP